MKPYYWQIAAGLGILVLLAASLCIRIRDLRNSTTPDNSDGRGSSGDLRGIEPVRSPPSSSTNDSPDISAVWEDPIELRIRSLVAAYAQELAVKRTEVWDPNLRWHKLVPPIDGVARSELCAMVHEGASGAEPLLIKLFDEEKSGKMRAALVHLLGRHQPQNLCVRHFQLRIVREERDEHLVELGIQALLWGLFGDRTRGPGGARRGRYGSPVFQYEHYNTEGVLIPRRSWVLPIQFQVDSQDIDPETMSYIVRRMVPASADYVHEVVVGLITGCRGQPEYAAALARLLPHTCGDVRTKLVEDLWQSDDPAIRLLAQENSRVMDNVYLSTASGHAFVKQSARAPIRGTTQVARIRVTNARGAFALGVTLELSRDGLTWHPAGCASLSALGTRELTVIDKREDAIFWRLRAEVAGTDVSVTFTVSLNWS